jgi:hypothetical protein
VDRQSGTLPSSAPSWHGLNGFHAVAFLRRVGTLTGVLGGC